MRFDGDDGRSHRPGHCGQQRQHRGAPHHGETVMAATFERDPPTGTLTARWLLVNAAARAQGMQIHWHELTEWRVPSY